MIDKDSLSRGIDILADLNAKIKDNADKAKLLELGYILKQELMFVKKWETEQLDDRSRGRKNIDLKKLLEDNTQLFNENRTLLEANNRMRNIIEQKIPEIISQQSSIIEYNALINGKIDELKFYGGV